MCFGTNRSGLSEEMLNSFDNALKGSTAIQGVSHFIPERAVGHLKDGQEHFEVLREDLPAELVEQLHGREFRSAVHDAESGKTWLEAISGESKPSLWDCTDTGAVGWMAKLSLYYYYGARGCECPDPLHRRIRSQANAITEARLTFVKTESELFMQYVNGPFHSCANFSTLKALAEYLFLNFDERSPFFRHFYGWIGYAETEGL